MMNEMKMIFWMMMVKVVISLTMMNDQNNQNHMGLVVRKPVFGVSDITRLKPVC